MSTLTTVLKVIRGSPLSHTPTHPSVRVSVLCEYLLCVGSTGEIGVANPSLRILLGLRHLDT